MRIPDPPQIPTKEEMHAARKAMTSMREKMAAALMALYPYDGQETLWEEGDCLKAVDAILSVLDEPSEGVCDVGTLERDQGNNGHGIIRAMIRAIRNGA